MGIKLADFRSVDCLEQEDRIAFSALAKRHDLGGLSEEVARKYLADGLRIIKTSEVILQCVLAACPCLPPNLRAAAREALLGFTAPPAGLSRSTR